MGQRMLNIFCYDISADQARGKVARILEEAGVRVQGSVFEVWASDAGAQRLADQIASYLGPGDSLRVYPLDARGQERAFVRGAGMRAHTDSFLLF